MCYSLHKSSTQVSTEGSKIIIYKLTNEIPFHCRTSPCIEDPVYVKAPYFSTSRLQFIQSKYKPN